MDPRTISLCGGALALALAGGIYGVKFLRRRNYLLGVESRPNDRNGRRHNLSVKTTRRGVSLRSRRGFVTSISAKATSSCRRSPVDLQADRPTQCRSVLSGLPKTTLWRILSFIVLLSVASLEKAGGNKEERKRFAQVSENKHIMRVGRLSH